MCVCVCVMYIYMYVCIQDVSKAPVYLCENGAALCWHEKRPMYKIFVTCPWGSN